MTYTSMNAILSAILSAPVTIKPKQGTPYTTTVGEDGVKHLPKVSDVKDENAVKALKAIGNAYGFILKSRTAEMGSESAVSNDTKAEDCIKEYLSALGLPTTPDCIKAIYAIDVLRASKVKDEDRYLPSSTGRATFQKNVLKITALAIEAGSWNVEKATAKATPKATTFEDLEQVYITTFGFSPEVAKELVAKARAAKAQF